jgi:hypothetical protein
MPAKYTFRISLRALHIGEGLLPRASPNLCIGAKGGSMKVLSQKLGDLNHQAKNLTVFAVLYC